MTHELSFNPIKLRFVDVKSGKWQESYIFVGSVSDDIKKELLRVEKEYNKNKMPRASNALKKFYGAKWKDILGLVERNVTGGNCRSADDISGSSEHDIQNEFSSVVDSIVIDEDYTASGGNASGGNASGGDASGGDASGGDALDGITRGITGGITEGTALDDTSADTQEYNIDDLDILSIGNIKISDADGIINAKAAPTVGKTADHSHESVKLDKADTDSISGDSSDKQDAQADEQDEQADEQTKPSHDTSAILPSSEITITEEELENMQDQALQIDLFQEREKTAKLHKSGDVKFVFDVCLYPADNILEFKYKIFVATGIPIYRQHLWFKYKGKSYPCSYDEQISKHSLHIDIETLIAYYQGTKKMDDIEGIPVDINNYNNKDYLQVSAKDQFNLLYTNYTKYSTVEYFMVDLNDLLDAKAIYNKLSKDRYQLEVIYYGFIILYFPMITYNVFLDYLKNEKLLADVYGDLRPDRATLLRRYSIEQLVTNEAYEMNNHPNKQITKRIFSSITDTIVSIDNYKQNVEVLLVLRNIFDMLVLNDTCTYCKAYILHENTAITLKKSYMNEAEPRDILQLNTLMIKIKTRADTNEHMKLIFFKNGNYIVKTSWREENHMTFDKIIKQISSKINPIITLINKMANRVKYYDVEIPILSAANSIFTETGIVFYYDDDMTEARYNVFKNVLEDFRRADIIGSKGVAGIAQEYFFHKGMYKFDVSRIDKTITLDNYYTYLSDGIVKQKWETIFDRTRSFQVINASSKLRITITGIKNDIEMEFFHLYLLGLINIYDKNASKLKLLTSESISNKSRKTLKNLKVQDPILYDFKKIYKSNVIYSKICQKPYQPLLLSDDEYKNLPKDKKSRAVHYWNFTKQKPVWYSCPNMKYPYIKFIIKQHPKDYCIPCCKKMMVDENVNIKKQNVHKTCLSDYQYTGEKINLTKGSHYIATYGKDIEIGRLSRLPEHTLEPLFFDTYSPDGGVDADCVMNDAYYLFGLDQHTVAVRHIGYMFCLLHSLGKNVENFLIDCAERIKRTPDKFRVLLDGNIGLYFPDCNALAREILLLNNDTLLQHETLPWNNLFISIGYYYYGVNTIVFEDYGKERIDLHLPNALKTTDEMFPDTHKNLIVLKRRTKYYPVYLLNTEIFKRTAIIDSKLFLNESGVIIIIKAIIRRYFETSDFEKIKTAIDLSVIKEFIKHNKLWKIVGYFINYANLCYALQISNDDNLCYVPIKVSHYSLEPDIELIFDTYSDKYSVSFAVLQKFITSYNKWVAHISKDADLLNATLYPKITINKWLAVHKTDEVFGFVSTGQLDKSNKVENTAGDMYYCKKMSYRTASSYHDAPIQYLLYNPSYINALIHSVKSGKKKIERNAALDHKLQKSLYNQHLYNLVLLQFISVFNKQRNIALRKKILICIAKTNFEKSTDKIKELVSTLDAEDANKLKNIIAKYLTVHHDKRKMSDDIHSTTFNFDRVDLERLKTLDRKKILIKLHQMSKKFIRIADVDKIKNFHFPNMLMSCDSYKTSNGNTADYCSGGKFLIKKDRLDEILDVLSHDVANPAKWKWIFNTVFIEKTVDFYKFVRRPAETITIEFDS